MRKTIMMAGVLALSLAGCKKFDVDGEEKQVYELVVKARKCTTYDCVDKLHEQLMQLTNPRFGKMEDGEARIATDAMGEMVKLKDAVRASEAALTKAGISDYEIFDMMVGTCTVAFAAADLSGDDLAAVRSIDERRHAEAAKLGVELPAPPPPTTEHLLKARVEQVEDVYGKFLHAMKDFPDRELALLSVAEDDCMLTTFYQPGGSELGQKALALLQRDAPHAGIDAQLVQPIVDKTSAAASVDDVAHAVFVFHQGVRKALKAPAAASR